MNRLVLEVHMEEVSLKGVKREEEKKWGGWQVYSHLPQ